MDVIDDEGNLFGVVNIVDVLVILFVVAVVVAGVALVYSDDPEPSGPEVETTYATLDLGTQPDYIVTEINEGDSFTPSGDSSLTITDVHLAPDETATRTIVRVKLEGPVSGESIQYNDAPPRLGRTLDITTDRYVVEGPIRDVGDSDTLTRESTTVVLTDTLESTNADSITPGDEIRQGDRTVATIDAVTAYSTNDSDVRRVYVETTLETYEQLETRRFGDTPIRSGQTVRLPGEGYTIEGSIERVGTLDDLGTTETRTAHLRIEGIHEDFANSIEPGMVDRVGGETMATLTGVDIQPSVLIFQGENAEIGVYDHPYERDVQITADLQVLDTDTGLKFKGRSIRQGDEISLDLGTITIRATLVRVE